MSGSSILSRIVVDRLLVGLLLLIMGGCTALPGRGDGGDLVTFTLEPSLEAIPQAAGRYSCLTVIVPPPRSAPGYATARMAYVQNPPRLDYFAEHQWADTPSRMLLDSIVGALLRSRAFGAVLIAPSPAEADLRLDTRVVQLRQLFDNGAASNVELVLEANLVNVDSGALLGQRLLRATVPAAPDPRGGAVAANRAAGEVLDDLTRFVLQRLDQAGIRCRMRMR